MGSLPVVPLTATQHNHSTPVNTGVLVFGQSDGGELLLKWYEWALWELAWTLCDIRSPVKGNQYDMYVLLSSPR